MIEGILVEGLVYGILAIGLFISFRILDFADLTVEGSFPAGSPLLAILAGFAAGGLAGLAGLLGALVASYQGFADVNSARGSDYADDRDLLN